MKRLITKTILISLALMLAFSFDGYAQRVDDVESILTKYKNYRFGAVNLYKITTPDELKEILNKKEDEVAGGDKGEEILKDLDPGIVDVITNGVLNGASESEIQRNLVIQGYTPPSNFSEVYQVIYKQNVSTGPEYTPKAYVITSRPDKGALPKRIVGLIYLEVPFEDAGNDPDEDLKNVGADQVYSYNALKDKNLDPATYGYDNLYDFVYAYFVQGNTENLTMEARGIGTDIRLFPKEYGVSSSLIQDNRISSRDIQIFKRISEGRPEEYIGKNHELVVSPDLVSWTQYEMQYERDRRGNIATDSTGKKIVSQRRPTNSTLPNFGLEMKYGIEGVNYPSFWSNRLSLSALWKNVKFGVILPTEGWASFSEDIYSSQRTMTYGGVGINGKLDFPFVVLPRSDVFSLSFGYIFGDAEPGMGTDMLNSGDPVNFQANPEALDYLMRFNAQLHYTFGISIDNDYYMRFGLGATGYSMESWTYRLVQDEREQPTTEFYEADSEFVGGVSGKIEFMTTNNATPFGGSVQYFDESLNINGWLQIPVIENAFSLRLEGNGYFTAFRQNPRAWEQSSVFIPMARIIYIF